MRTLATVGVLAACAGESGTVQLGLATAPGSTLLDEVTLLRVTLTEPRTVLEARRSASGRFELAFDVEATGVAGQLVVEGLDDSETVRATGMSPPFPLAALDARVVVYMAEPLSIGRAPLELVPRGDMAAARLPYGAAFVGGTLAEGALSDAMSVYNAFDHSLAAGLALPEARRLPALGVDAGAGIYIFGGTSPAAAATGTLMRFDTTVAPAGRYTPVGDAPEHARAGEIALAVGPNRFVVTGAPALLLAAGALAPRPEAGRLYPRGAVAFDDDTQPVAIMLGERGIVRYADDAFDVVADSAPTDAAVTALPDGRVWIVGGTRADTPTADALLVDVVTGTVTTIAGALELPRTRAVAAATARHVVVAGGTDDAGVPLLTAEIFDAVSLQRLATVPVEARVDGFAVALPNDQILLGGGETPTGVLELFTPPAP